MKTYQTSLFTGMEIFDYKLFPQTRFQGSKSRLIDRFHKVLSKLKYETVLDAFSGSGVVSYYFKTQNKRVTSNDILRSSFITSKALIENSSVIVEEELLRTVLELPDYESHPHVIEKNYEGFYFTEKENVWLDGIISNINCLSNEYAKAIFYWALFQACIIKRPYNLFHRANLSMRLEHVKRSFGNKVTWDRAFPEYIRKFVKESNQAIFDNKRKNKALNKDISMLSNEDYDLVYLDPPYMKAIRNLSGNDYQDYYHFLEGILDYGNWENCINYKLKHNTYSLRKSSWINPSLIVKEFERLISKFQDSTIVISYNTEGYPSPDKLQEILYSYKENVEIKFNNIKYALKKKKKQNTEVLIIA